MKEKEVVEAVKKHVMMQKNAWKYVFGREVLTKKDFLERLDKDKKFRETIVNMVINLSIDLLTRNSSESTTHS